MDLFYRSERSDRDGAWMRSDDSLTLFVVRRIAAMPLIANPRCIAFMKGALVGGKKRAIVRCSIADGQSIPK